MDALKRFTIPLKGIKIGGHEFKFDLNSTFFSHFEESPIQEGQFTVNLTFDKRPEMLVLDFDISGKVPTKCDRCLAAIQLPVESATQLVVKFSDQDKDPDEEIIYLPWETPELNIAPYIYENIVLALPLIQIYECREEAPFPCDEKMLQYLDGEEEATPKAEDEADNPIWSELKKKFNNDN